MSSHTGDWWTPPEIIDRVLRLWPDGIDLDPCSNIGHPTVPAGRHYTIEDDGLAQGWAGRVYLNPPYGRQIDRWVMRLVAGYESGEVIEAIALVPARTDTAWWAMLKGYPVMFCRGRLRFGGPNVSGPAPFPSAVVYLGTQFSNFYDAFAGMGPIYLPIRAPFIDRAMSGSYSTPEPLALPATAD